MIYLLSSVSNITITPRSKHRSEAIPIPKKVAFLRGNLWTTYYETM